MTIPTEPELELPASNVNCLSVLAFFLFCILILRRFQTLPARLRSTRLAQLPQFAGEVFSFQCEICEVSTTCARILWPKAALSGDVAGAQAGVDWVDRCSVFAR